MATSLHEQLALLRKRIQKVEARFAPATEPEDASCLGGAEVETALGKHWELTRTYPHEHLHGKLPVERLRDLSAKPWVYLDTETTGLAGGAGTMAFLIGAASVEEDGFVMRQWFIREHGEEASALSSLAEYLTRFDTLVSYNGRSYDQPLLETRYTLSRQRTPFSRMEHLDLLYGARRLWKLRYESCRLVELERQVLGHERVGDVPGELIPQLYFEYLRTRRAGKLKPVLEHNALDILSLAFLAAIIPAVFDDPRACSLGHGAELSGVARWLVSQDRLDEAAEMYRRSIDAPMGDELLFRALWEWALVEKKRENAAGALSIWSDLARSKNPYRAEALEELAKYYEHTEKNLFMALECVVEAEALGKTMELRHRRERLERKLAKPSEGRGLWGTRG
ncbi:ribonuclease H-like domain-containing protein [Bryobacter aggregatus]|uniref:ribonuclease H-like domain-containing protein n=1 Tax=Bryobacter aggregatus TaxID=360054 RepID=UPI000689E712|nr:ribonuclease H-like domain-containing protein [Bryobacter aggregatus]